MAYEYPAAIIITDTNAHTGRFGKVHCLTDASATFVAENITETRIFYYKWHHNEGFI